jgi:hypothetical protein
MLANHLKTIITRYSQFIFYEKEWYSHPVMRDSRSRGMRWMCRNCTHRDADPYASYHIAPHYDGSLATDNPLPDSKSYPVAPPGNGIGF